MSNLGIALLSPKRPSSIAAQRIEPLPVAQQLRWKLVLSTPMHLYSARHRVLVLQQNLALFITPQINSVGQKVGEKEYKPDTSLLGLFSAPSLLAALSLFSSKGSRLFLPLACQHQMTFELC